MTALLYVALVIGFFLFADLLRVTLQDGPVGRALEVLFPAGGDER